MTYCLSLLDTDTFEEELVSGMTIASTTPLSTTTIKPAVMALCNSYNITREDLAILEATTFWVEGVLQLVVGCLGLLSNLFAIYILSCEKLKNLFNRLLACLLMVHTVYIFSTATIVLSRDHYTRTVFFSYFLYPLRPLALHSSTFITVLMARQRFLAIRHPVEYRNSNLGTNPWIPALKYLTFTVVACAAFVSPLLLETEVSIEHGIQEVRLNETHIQFVSSMIPMNTCAKKGKG